MAVTTQRPATGMLEVAGGGAGAEVVGGIGAIVLSILGLANVAPGLMLAIATIVIGAALVLEGAVLAAEYSRLMTPAVLGTAGSEMTGGLTIEFLAGIAGIVLGILALLGINDLVLTASSAIVFGAALVLSSGSITRLNDLKIQLGAGAAATETAAQAVAHEAVSAASGAQIFTGLAAVVLGILALTGVQGQILTLVALLAVAVTILLSGSAVSGKVFSILKSQ